MSEAGTAALYDAGLVEFLSVDAALPPRPLALDSRALDRMRRELSGEPAVVIHPGTTTHQQMDADALKAAGISEGLVRLSVGLEDSDDLIDDLGRALKASQRA